MHFKLFKGISTNIRSIFSKRGLFVLAAAITLTLTILFSGLDWAWFVSLRGTVAYSIGFPAVIIGAIVPVLGTLIYLMLATISKSATHVRNAWCLGQAALLGYVASAILKAFTGRMPPPREFFSTLVDNSHGFNLGFLEHGIFWGWPSSHTTVAFAMAGAIIGLYPKNKLVWFAAFIYATYVGFGVSISIHWLSEFVAGAIIGLFIGLLVGRNEMRRS